MDRWCKRCNAYRTTMRCGRCDCLTDAALVQPAIPNPPKVKCAGCAAPFTGYRFKNESGFPIGVRYAAKLKDVGGSAELHLYISLTEESGTFRRAQESLDSRSTVESCPHCDRPLLHAQVENFSSYPVATTYALLARPDGGIFLEVQSLCGGDHGKLH